MGLNGVLMGFNGDSMGFNGIYDGIPSGKHTKSELEAMAHFEIVTFPIFIAWWIFPVRYVKVYQRVCVFWVSTGLIPSGYD